MTRHSGKVNYNINMLIDVVEDKLPQGALGWQEVAVVYQLWTQETVLRDHDDIKRYWRETLCHRYQKPTGKPGDQHDRMLP
jgi:hypothetical protein